jgi:hypothetical protein
LKPIADQPNPPSGTEVTCDVAAFACLRLTAAELQSLRQNLVLPSGERIPPSFLKHAEDQTIAALATVARAISASFPPGVSFTEWGVLGAPRFLGRMAMNVAIAKFNAEGAWGLSPHLIPHRLLHALSGTLSQAFKMQGPNFGVGGGPTGVAETMRAAAGLLAGNRLPGLWVVMTGCDPETDTERCKGPDTSLTSALAIALTPPQSRWQGLRVRTRAAQLPTEPSTADTVSLETFQKLLGELDRTRMSGASYVLANGIVLESVESKSRHPLAIGNGANGNGRHDASHVRIGAGVEKRS